MCKSDGMAWEVAGGIGRIVLARPEQANSLTPAVARALAGAVDAVLAAGPRVVLLAAEGPIFCAGADLGEFAAAADPVAFADDILTPLNPALLRLATAPVPVVAAVGGAVAGAGIGLALCADFVLGAASLKLRPAYAAIGLSPDAGASYFLARRVGPLRAQRWLMLGDTIGAEECLRHGAVDALHPDAELAGVAEALAAHLAASARAALAGIKTLCGGLPGRDMAEHLALEHRLVAACVRGANSREGVSAFLEKRPPRFPAPE